MKFDSAFLIGLGGIGSHLASALTRLLLYHPNGTDAIYFVDGDVFETTNQTRQLFPHTLVGTPKAKAIAQHLGFAQVTPICEYINGSELLELAESHKGPTLVVLAVDNDATRLSIETALVDSDLDFVLVNAGNRLTTAMVSVLGAKGSELIGTKLSSRYANIAHPTDQMPARCAERAPGEPQLLVANALAATMALNLVWKLLEGQALPDEVCADAERALVSPSAISLSFPS